MSTLINPTWWALCVAVIVLACARQPRTALTSMARRACPVPVLMVVAAAAVANIGARVTLGHVLPGDFVQEVVAARQLSAAAPLYSADINLRAQEWLSEDPAHVPGWLPGPIARRLVARQLEGRNRLAAQAHPPTLLVAGAPLVLAAGPRRAYWLLSLATLVAGALTAVLIVSTCLPGLSLQPRVLAVLLLLSWQPLLACLREGQVSVLVGALLTLAWWHGRARRWGRSGLAAGAAAALKLYPLLVLLAFARSRRGAAAAAAVLIAAAAVTTAVTGIAAWSEYASAARLVGRSFADAPHNLSLVARLGSALPAGLQWPTFAFIAAGLLTTTVARLRRVRSAGALGRADLEFAAFITLALLLSPVAWHHYVFMLALPLAVAWVKAWEAPGRGPLVAVALLALILSVPDDGWRAVWRQVPDGLGLLASPAVAALALWARLLWDGVRTDTPEQTSFSPAA